MSCSSNLTIVREELEFYLNSILEQNNQLEMERNELKVTFRQRPAEEKNLMKNVLFIHNEFDSGIAKVKGMIEVIAVMPETKVERTAKAEEIAKDMVRLQTELVRKHEILAKLVTQRQNYKNMKESALSQDLRIQASINENKFKVTEIENYEHGNLYSRKLKVLNSELSRLKSSTYSGLASPFPEPEVNISGLSSAQASIKLQEIQGENKKIEQELGALNNKYINQDTYARLNREVEAKKSRIADLRKILKLKAEEIDSISSETGTSARSKLRILTNIIGRKSPMSLAEQLSPRSMKLRSNTLLQDIEMSLKRVRSIASPMPKS